MLSWYGGALVQSATTPGTEPVAGDAEPAAVADGDELAGAEGDDAAALGVVDPAGGLVVVLVAPHAARSRPRASSAQAAGVAFNIRMPP